MDRVEAIASRAFLGSEFLTWLWFRIEAGEGTFALEKGSLDLFVDEKMTLESLVGNATTATLSGTMPSDSIEASTGLRDGKTLTSAAFRLKRAEREWKFGLKGRTLDLAIFHLPAILTKAEDDRFYERMALLDELVYLLDQLYGMFLGLRLNDGWDRELSDMRAWAAET